MKEYHKQGVAQQTLPRNSNENVYVSINMISVLVGVIVMGAFIYDNHSVTVSVLAGVGFYGAVAGLLILSPYAADVIIAHMKEVTIRRFNSLPYEAQDAQQALQVVDHPRIASSQSVAPARLPEGARYIPAVPRIEPTVKADATNFVLQLWDISTGKPTKITPNAGQIQHPKPSPEAIEYLMALGIVRREGGKQLYWSPHYRTWRQAIDAINTGVNPTFLEQGEGRVLEVGEL